MKIRLPPSERSSAYCGISHMENNKKMVFFAPVIWLYGPFSHPLKGYFILPHNTMISINKNIPKIIEIKTKHECNC